MVEELTLARSCPTLAGMKQWLPSLPKFVRVTWSIL